MTEEQTPKTVTKAKRTDKWTVFQEAAAKDAKVGEVLGRCGIDSSQLSRTREQVRSGALEELNKRPGRRPKDAEKEQLRQELSWLE